MRLARRAGLFSLSLAALLTSESFAGSLFPANPFSDAAVGTTSAPFLKQLPGARAQALGGTFAAVGGEPEGMFWNPAGLAGVGASAFGLSYNPLLETAAMGSLAYVAGAEDGAWGLGLVYHGQSPLEGFNALGDPTGSFRAFDYSPSITLARELYGAHVGLGVKAVVSSLAGEQAATVAGDLGILGREVTKLADGDVDVGAYVRNFGPPLKRGSQSDPLPFQAAAGMLWRAYPDLHILADARLPVDQDPFISIGVEYHRAWPDLALALRGGYNLAARRGLDGSAGLSAGFGLRLSRFGVDYAWVPMGELGTTHRISLGWWF